MHLAITFRNFEASESLKDHTRERLERLGRNLDRACTAHVVMNLERHIHHADVTFTTGALVHYVDSMDQLLVEASEYSARDVRDKMLAADPSAIAPISGS